MNNLEMKLSIPIIETIEKRQSVRTYKKDKLSIEDREKIMQYMDNLTNPFENNVKMHIVDKDIDINGEKLGTYGIIKGASTFIGVSIPNTKLSPLAAGYEFENLILYATNMGLGTVWMAATFNRHNFSKAMNVNPEYLFVAISPLGYPAEKRSIKESIMRSTMKSSSRKPWESLFYNEDFSTPLTKNESGEYALPLDMLRLAPSAKNEQPWRVQKCGDVYNFYITYPSDISIEEAIIKKVDLGIGLAHFHQTVMDQGLKGYFKEIPQQEDKLPKDTYYVISWCVE